MPGCLSTGSCDHGGDILGGIMSWLRKGGQQLDNAYKRLEGIVKLATT
jgi:hypothetical protein